MAEKLNLKLRKPTPRALRSLHKAGYLGLNHADQWNKLVKLYIGNDDDLRNVMEICFEGDFSETNIEEIDLKQVSCGVMDFLFNALALSPRSNESASN